MTVLILEIICKSFNVLDQRQRPCVYGTRASNQVPKFAKLLVFSWPRGRSVTFETSVEFVDYQIVACSGC